MQLKLETSQTDPLPDSVKYRYEWMNGYSDEKGVVSVVGNCSTISLEIKTAM